MSLDTPKPQSINGAAFKVGIVAARFNGVLVDALLHQAYETLVSAGVKEKNIRIHRVPGSNEAPSAVQLLAASQKPDVLIALGVLIRGDTIHYEVIADASAHALQRVALDTRTPVINGIIVAENQQQAKTRCLGKIARGSEFAHTALEMAALKKTLSAKK
ncbi:6,7-dimethyl-8-ribityllumazine synthase [Ereboglobus sp. PH5-5]|uniref:6,7-dimethyl-8-ribityllumazine synthase n=1 Tax=Ereboglobus luteus TaxID=1796921 RepID=A0A2U8E4A0_9BACT|nr:MULTISPECIES: 6,7-dimethyl-8-ribityllumazine synthase [Ereboglobus]AWI09758.1 6,7-dimethyl-8-ribityllumazine synthase [Ereboglobus luteus]MDF9833017.1 6,7-dimethyl-8-ribityllumazine synthase [Ereboglobus sp. PH5-5]